MLTISRKPKRDDRNSIFVLDENNKPIGKIIITKHNTKGSDIKIHFLGMEEYRFLRGEIFEEEKLLTEH